MMVGRQVLSTNYHHKVTVSKGCTETLTRVGRLGKRLTATSLCVDGGFGRYRTQTRIWTDPGALRWCTDGIFYLLAGSS